MAQIVLIVDRDLGFVFWLGRALDEAGYFAIPAKSVEDAIELGESMKLPVDLLVVSEALPGAAGLVKVLHGMNQHLRVMTILENEEIPAQTTPGADGSRAKPVLADEISRLEWVRAVQRTLEVAPSKASSGHR